MIRHLYHYKRIENMTDYADLKQVIGRDVGEMTYPTWIITSLSYLGETVDEAS